LAQRAEGRSGAFQAGAKRAERQFRNPIERSFGAEAAEGAEAATVSQPWLKGLKGAAQRFRPGRNVPNGSFEVLGLKPQGGEAATVSQPWHKGLKGAAEHFRPGRNVPNGSFETLSRKKLWG